LVVSGRTSEVLQEVNLSTFKLAKTIALADEPSDLVYMGTSHALAVLSASSTTVEFLQATNGSPELLVQIGTGTSFSDGGDVLAYDSDTLMSPNLQVDGEREISSASGSLTYPTPGGYSLGIVTNREMNLVEWVCGNGQRTAGCHPSVPESTAVGTDPIAIDVDTNRSVREAFVANAGSDNVTILRYNVSGPTVQPVGTYRSLYQVANVSVGSRPSAILFDPYNNLVYVANSGGDNLTVVNPVSNTVIASIVVGFDPAALLLDPYSDLLYVANAGSSNVSIVNGSTDRVSSTLATSSGPDSLMISQTHQLFVGCSEGGTVDEFQGGVLTLSTFVGTGSMSLESLYDEWILIANYGDSVVQVLYVGR
jgi:YVTN family beta-propeller protein